MDNKSEFRILNPSDDELTKLQHDYKEGMRLGAPFEILKPLLVKIRLLLRSTKKIRRNSSK